MVTTPLTATYSKIEEIVASPQYGNTGPDGWGFTLWSDLLDDEAPHRQMLERFALAYPQAGISLPKYHPHEDFVECYATWNSASVWIYYETLLSHLWLWSADRDAAAAIKAALVSFVG
jgi:hypothetical protein